jgi:hypothetical protein
VPLALFETALVTHLADSDASLSTQAFAESTGAVTFLLQGSTAGIPEGQDDNRKEHGRR